MQNANERLRPATEREITVALHRLRAIFGYEEGAWKVAFPLYLEALGDLPGDLLAEAVGIHIRTGEERFPKPAQLRSLVDEQLAGRREAVQREMRRERRSEGRERWPDWLRELWGPEPEGPIARRNAIAARQKAYLAGTRLQPIASRPEDELRQARDALGLPR